MLQQTRFPPSIRTDLGDVTWSRSGANGDAASPEPPEPGPRPPLPRIPTQRRGEDDKAPITKLTTVISPGVIASSNVVVGGCDAAVASPLIWIKSTNLSLPRGQMSRCSVRRSDRGVSPCPTPKSVQSHTRCGLRPAAGMDSCPCQGIFWRADRYAHQRHLPWQRRHARGSGHSDRDCRDP